MTDSATKKFDLEERTTRFGEEVVKLCNTVTQNAVTRPIISQVVRSSTSIGANYMEANGASSKKDFRNKIHIVLKECQETKHSLRMLAAAVPDKKQDIRTLWKECQELTLIFQKVVSTLRTPVSTTT